jgi:hypothetical protein
MTQSRRPLGLFLLVLAVETAAALAQCPAGRWVTLAPMNEPRQELAAAQLDGSMRSRGSREARRRTRGRSGSVLAYGIIWAALLWYSLERLD